MKQVDLNRLLEETLELAEYELKKHKVTVVRKLDGALPAVRGDGEKLKLLTKRLWEAAGIPVVDYKAVTKASFESQPDQVLDQLEPLPWPVFVKPILPDYSEPV